MTDLLQAQIAFTLWFQSLNPALDAVFNTFNLLQSEEFMLLVLPIVWWCIDKRIGASLLILFTSTEFLSRFLKNVTGETRPYDLDRRVRDLDHQPDSSFPSAGTLDVLILWGYLATQFRNRALWVWAICAVVMIASARVYLGAHYPTDVLASLLIGLLVLAVVVRGRVVERFAARPRVMLWVMAIGWPLLLAAIMLNPESAVSLGAMLGFNIGLMIETQVVRFDPRGEWWKQIVKFALALAIVMALRLGIKPLLPPGDIFSFIRYAVIGLWIGVGAPWMFVTMRLSSSLRRGEVR
ncbi:MAG: phosphatase PAP2 family protein [Chloroflexi bacterium]|nr:phosphatase PAP2 family protein [Chloroflexota bacterium]